MLAKTPPMGWNSWNTFAHNIDEQLVMDMADIMVNEGYKDAGYEYVVIDDCWALKERDENGHLVADPAKFPHGMKYVSDYIHQKGLKFGMYSCAGILTCAGYPSSYGHEFEDAKTFASWGVDFLKYDFCNFPDSGHCKQAYLTMSQALRASGREILFSACNWGVEDPGKWMRSIGAHMYRTTGDIFDNYTSMKDIALSQADNLCVSAPGCFNDPDMLIVGMYGKGHVGMGGCTDEEYRMHFALWCLFGVPLMIGGDLRTLNDFCKDLLKNKELIKINQDEDARPPYTLKTSGENTELVQENGVTVTKYLDRFKTFLKLLSDGSYVLGLFNFSDDKIPVPVYFDDAGLPYYSGLGFELTDIFTGECLGIKYDSLVVDMEPHTVKLYKAVVKPR